MNQELSLQSIFEPQLGSTDSMGIEAVTSRGHGTFTAGSLNFPARFSVLRRLSHASVILEREELGNHAHVLFLPHVFSLLGSLDDGRSIRIESLQAVSSNDSFVEMTPRNCAVEVGVKSVSSPLRARYTLTGLYHGNINLDFQDWKIQICADSDSFAKARASKALKIPLDGATLNLSSSLQEKTANDYDEFAESLFTLLSLAHGNGITSHCWAYSYPDGHELELWRRRFGDDIGPGPIIDHTELGSFLKECLPHWLQLSDRDQHVMSVAVLHLNTSGLGFLDNRLLQVAQIWELLATEWGRPEAMHPDMQQLRNSLKAFLRQWRDTNPGCDSDGKITGRILTSLQRDTLLSRINSMVESFGLCTHLIGLDIAMLKAVRDKAAHSISAGASDENAEEMLKLLLAARAGIQLLLLRKLYYSGFVIFHDKDWQGDRCIEHFFAHT